MIEVENAPETMEKGYDPDAEIARVVLRSVLGDSFSREDEEFHEKAWSEKTGRVAKLAHESWADFRKRRALKEKEQSAKPQQSLYVDQESAREMLARLIEKHKQSIPLNDREQSEAHELEDLLGRERTDFSKPAKLRDDDSEAKSLKRYAVIQQQLLWSERLKRVQKENDIGALNLVAMRDARDEVRQAAQNRILELEIA